MKKGSITVFSALSMMLIVSFLLALLESARVYGLDTYAKMRTENGIESVCGEYQSFIWRNYDLLMLDGAYGGTEFSMENVSRRLTNHVSDRAFKEKKEAGISGMDLFLLELESANPIEYQLLTDHKGDVFLGQIAAVMKERIPLAVAESIYSHYTEGKEKEDKGIAQTGGGVDAAIHHANGLLEEAIEQKKQEHKQKSQETGGEHGQKDADTGDHAFSEDAYTKEKVENPLDIVLELKRNTVLDLVCPKGTALSDYKMDLSQGLKRRERIEGTMDLAEEADWYQRILVLEYLEQYFSCFTKQQETENANYDIEYLIAGKETAKNNLENVINRLLIMREAVNITYLLGDTEKMNTAKALATAIGSFSGNPVVIKALEIAIVGAWAFVESIQDVRTLLAGGKIALIKNKEQWTTDVSHLLESFQGTKQAKTCENGLRYEDYLKQILFFMNREKLAYRMMDIMEQRLRAVEEYKNCRMDCMIVKMRYQLSYVAEPLFFSNSWLQNQKLGQLRFQKEAAFSYVP